MKSPKHLNATKLACVQFATRLPFMRQSIMVCMHSWGLQTFSVLINSLDRFGVLVEAHPERRQERLREPCQ